MRIEVSTVSKGLRRVTTVTRSAGLLTCTVRVRVYKGLETWSEPDQTLSIPDALNLVMNETSKAVVALREGTPYEGRGLAYDRAAARPARGTKVDVTA